MNVVCVNAAVSEVSDEQIVVIESAKMPVVRYFCQAPGRVQQAPRNQALEIVTVRVVNIDEPMMVPFYIIMLVGVLQSVCDVDLAVDIRNTKRGISFR